MFLLEKTLSQSVNLPPFVKQPLFPKSDTGGEIKKTVSGRLLHHLFERRGAALFWGFSS
jgi:hypothetical protein